MLEHKFITKNLQKTFCYKCGKCLENAIVEPITEAPMAWIGHAVCPSCKAEGLITITPSGNGIVPVQSDLAGKEFKKFVGVKPVNSNELLDLYVSLKKEKIWKLMQKKEKNSVKKQDS